MHLVVLMNSLVDISKPPHGRPLQIRTIIITIHFLSYILVFNAGFRVYFLVGGGGSETEPPHSPYKDEKWSRF